MTDWKREIAIAHLVKQKVSEVDANRLWKYYLPEVAASEPSIDAGEKRLGIRLDPEHRAFLKHADGWKAFFHAVDVFGVQDLVEGPRHERAIRLLESLEDLKPLCGFDREELLPIAVSATDIDLFVISKADSDRPGVVLWLAGQLIDRFPSFAEWFLAMVDYNRREYQRMTGQLGP